MKPCNQNLGDFLGEWMVFIVPRGEVKGGGGIPDQREPKVRMGHIVANCYLEGTKGAEELIPGPVQPG